jgi:hypothetical protein
MKDTRNRKLLGHIMLNARNMERMRKFSRNDGRFAKEMACGVVDRGRLSIWIK